MVPSPPPSFAKSTVSCLFWEGPCMEPFLRPGRLVNIVLSSPPAPPSGRSPAVWRASRTPMMMVGQCKQWMGGTWDTSASSRGGQKIRINNRMRAVDCLVCFAALQTSDPLSAVQEREPKSANSVTFRPTCVSLPSPAPFSRPPLLPFWPRSCLSTRRGLPVSAS
jgi:hypothetical protein